MPMQKKELLVIVILLQVSRILEAGKFVCVNLFKFSVMLILAFYPKRLFYEGD
jgi:hypothetical protein